MIEAVIVTSVCLLVPMFFLWMETISLKARLREEEKWSKKWFRKYLDEQTRCSQMMFNRVDDANSSRTPRTVTAPAPAVPVVMQGYTAPRPRFIPSNGAGIPSHRLTYAVTGDNSHPRSVTQSSLNRLHRSVRIK